MITAQEIRDVRFTKSMGGYKTAEVDTFLDECADTFEKMAAELAENERKLQVLAESVLEYRNQEDSIRTAVINAQRMSDSLIEDAKSQSEALVADAKVQADAILAIAQKDSDEMLGKTREGIVSEQEELQRIKDEVVAFKARLLATYREHLTLIGILADKEDVHENTRVPNADSLCTEASDSPIAEEEKAADTDNNKPWLFNELEEQSKLELSPFELKDDED